MSRRLRALCLSLMLSCLAVAVGAGGPTARAHAQAGAATSSPGGGSSNQADEEDDDTQKEELPWRGSSFAFSQMLGDNSLSRAAYLSYDPYYAFRFELELEWHFTQSLHASLWQALDVELTDSNTTTRKQQPMLLDTQLRLDDELWHHGPANKHDAALIGGVSLVAPTSLASQAASMIIGTGVHLGGSVSWHHVLHGAGVGLDGGYLRRFTESTTVRSETQYPCFLGSESSQLCSQLGGPTNVRDVLTLTLSAHLELTQRVSLVLAGALWWRQGYELAPACASADSGSYCVNDQSNTHWRNLRILRLSVGYHAYDWLGLTLMAASISSEVGPDGQYRSPFHGVDAFLGLTAEVLFDQLYLAARGPGTATRTQGAP